MNAKMISAPAIGADDFSRRLSLRSRNLMWFLGAGASASAGIPTASDMVWEFKQQLYVSQRRVSLQAVTDLSNPAIRSILQAHIDSSERLPPAGATSEYAELFEAVYPAEADRGTYVDAKVAGAKPSYGHLALATLMRAGLARLVWTTNFDTLMADGCAKIYGATGFLTTVALDAPELGMQLIAEERWPIEIKLHGDFRSRRLKNTSDELRRQDVRLRQLLIDCCRRFGLIVIGYSGRDDSIMDALETAAEETNAFPTGLFWLHREETPPLPRVTRMLASAVEKGVEAAFVPVKNFDETLRDLMRMIEGIDTKELEVFAAERRVWSGAPWPGGQRGWPVIRLNALPILQAPTACRRIVCQIGGLAQVREAVKQAGVNVLVARTRVGVLAYGADAELRTAFGPHKIVQFDLHTIETRRLRYESGERGLLREALTCAIARRHGLTAIRRRRADLLTPANPDDPLWEPLRRLAGDLSGVVEDEPDLRWCEGVAVRLDWADDRLWLLVDPCTVFNRITDANRAAAADHARERTVRRYNRQLNDLIAFWAEFLAGKASDLCALGIADGVDAIFRLSPDTGFTMRAQP